MATRKAEDAAVGDIWKCRFGHLFMIVQTSTGDLKLLCLRGEGGDIVGRLYLHNVAGWQKVGHFDGI
jgi:hypothetical protein